MPRNKKGPTVIAAEHGNFFLDLSEKERYSDTFNKYIETVRKVKSVFDEKAMEKKRRTLFIEMTPAILEKILKFLDSGRNENELYPFAEIIAMAKNHGWNIQALDRESITGLVYKAKLVRNPSPETPPRKLYLQHNLRERHWANKVRQQAGQNDLIVMDPHHVRGFLIEGSLKSENVVWVDSPAKHNRKRYRRLTAKEVRKLKRTREFARRKNQVKRG